MGNKTKTKTPNACHPEGTNEGETRKEKEKNITARSYETLQRKIRKKREKGQNTKKPENGKQRKQK